MPGYVTDIHNTLDQRSFTGAGEFDTVMSEYAETYARFEWTARVRNGPQPGGAYYLKSCDKSGRRTYCQVHTTDSTFHATLSSEAAMRVALLPITDATCCTRACG